MCTYHKIKNLELRFFDSIRSTTLEEHFHPLSDGSQFFGEIFATLHKYSFFSNRYSPGKCTRIIK